MSRVDNGAQQQQELALKDQYTGLITSTMKSIPPDYTTKQKADITSGALGGIDVGYGNLRDELTRRASATGSSAGLPEALLEATRESTQAKAQAGAGLAQQFADQPTKQALAKASVFQPAVSGMLYDRYPSPSSGVASSALGAAGTAAMGIGIAM